MFGDVVGSYRVVEKLGSGGMGEVWAAEHVLLGRKVAIKFLLPEVSGNEGIVKRFFDEARAASQIADPGIVAVFDFGWHATHGAYIIMEHVAGESLSSRVRERRLPLDHAVRIVQQAALTMAVAHGRGIIHRDLKPDNIFLLPDPVMPGGERVKILDFGIAKLVVADGTASNTRTDVVMGTPAYMSPEQCRGAAGVDHRTDIYALGCLLFRLLCGRLPFDKPTAGDMIASHLTEQPPEPSSIVPTLPPAVDAIVARCLQKSPDDRYATMTDLARALAAAGGFPVEVSTIPPIRTSGRTPRPPTEETAGLGVPTTLGHSAAQSISAPPRSRRGTWIALTASLFVVGVVGTAVVLGFERRETISPSAMPSGAPELASPGPSTIDAGLDAAVRDGSVADALPPDALVRKRTTGVHRGSGELYDNR